MTPTQMNFEYILIKIFIYFAFLLSPKRLVQLKRARARNVWIAWSIAWMLARTRGFNIISLVGVTRTSSVKVQREDR